jgi:hypothetical protein
MGEVNAMAYEITNQNDIFFFFEMIKKIEPDSILDVGLFLQRIGAISHHVLDMSIPEGVVCDGIRLGDQVIFPVTQTLYRSFYDLCEPDASYDLVSLMGATDFLSRSQEETLWQWLKTHARCVITDCKQVESMPYLQTKGAYTSYLLENDTYALIIPR